MVRPFHRNAVLFRSAVLLATTGAVTALAAGPAAAGGLPTPVSSLVQQYSSPSPSPSGSPSATPTYGPSPSPSPSTTATPPPPGPDGGHAEPDHPAPLTGIDLDAQVAEANRISALLEGSSSRVAVEMKAMDVLSDQSNAVLESLASATDKERVAQHDADTAHTDLTALEGRLASARAIVRDWVFDVYSGGGNNADITGMFDAMESDDDRVGDPLGDLSYLTDQRTRALQMVRYLTAEQVRLTAAAETAEKTAHEARLKIAADKTRLDDLMKVQSAKIGELRKLQIAEVEKAGPVASILIGARSGAAQAAAERLRNALSAAVVESAHVGKPCSDDTGLYPNGMFPATALCPVWGAPGERLSPAAAASFSALSQAYAAQTGTPLCITDSYRSLPEQVSIKGTRGKFAATPGTSRHGLGRAVDLCGGVDDFGSAAHHWMRQNAPLYGWFHPAWAEAGGSLPEPWHWEYAG